MNKPFRFRVANLKQRDQPTQDHNRKENRPIPFHKFRPASFASKQGKAHNVPAQSRQAKEIPSIPSAEFAAGTSYLKGSLYLALACFAAGTRWFSGPSGLNRTHP